MPEWYTQKLIDDAINKVSDNWNRYKQTLLSKGSALAHNQWANDHCPLCDLFDDEDQGNENYTECVREGIPCPVLATFGFTCHDWEHPKKEDTRPLINNILTVIDRIEKLKGYTIGKDDKLPAKETP